MKAEVYSVLPAGSEWYVKAKIGSEVVMVSTTNEPRAKIGDLIWVSIKQEKLK